MNSHFSSRPILRRLRWQCNDQHSTPSGHQPLRCATVCHDKLRSPSAMNGHFDPYYIWLGIPPAQQPPHHYRLLGVEVFESDWEVIDSAANQRMTYLQELASGDHIKESQQLLNAIA